MRPVRRRPFAKTPSRFSFPASSRIISILLPLKSMVYALSLGTAGSTASA